MKRLLLLGTFIATAFMLSCQNKEVIKNKVAGTWKPLSATVYNNGIKTFPYGPNPTGRLIFTPEMQFLEYIVDSEIPPFKSDIRGKGSDEENRRLLNGSLALYGTYTVDEEGNFTGNLVEGSSFPNWVGNSRTTDDLSLVVKDSIMTELFFRPSGARVEIVWKRMEYFMSHPITLPI